VQENGKPGQLDPSSRGVTSSESSLRPRSMAFFSTVLGGVSIFAVLLIGFLGYHWSVRDAELRFQRYYQNKALLLAQMAELREGANPEESLSIIRSAWEQEPDKPLDEYICIVDSSSELILHTGAPSTVGNFAGDNLVLGNEERLVCSLKDLVHSGKAYAGGYVSSAGEEQLVAFVPVADWMLGVHRSRSALHSEIRASLRYLMAMFFLSCGVLTPFSFGLLYWAFTRNLRLRQEAERAFRESEERYRDIVETTSDLITRTDGQGRFTYLNHVAERVYGLGVNQCRGEHAFDFLHPDDREKAQAWFLGCVDSRTRHDAIENRQVNKVTGTIFHMFWTCDFHYDEEGDCVAVNGIAHDVSERKEAEKALRASEGRLRGAIVEAPFPIMLHAEDGEVLMLSKVWTNITGYGPADIPTIEDWARKAYGEEGTKAKDYIAQQCAMDSRVEEGEWVIKTKSGESLVWSFSSAPLDSLPDGRRLVISMAMDITERKRAEEALQESERNLAWAQVMAHIGHWTLQPDTLEVSGSDELFRIFGLSREEATLDAFATAVHPEEREYVSSLIQRTMDRGDGYDIEHRLVCKDGTEKTIRAMGEAVVDEKGKTVFLRGFTQDISDRKQAEESLQESEERFRLMMQQSPSVIELYNLDGLQVAVNAAYENLWGFPASHTVNQFNVLESEEVKKTGLIEYVKRAYAGEEVRVPDYEFNSTGTTEGRGQGRTRWLSTRMYPIKDSVGKVKNIAITYEDISDNKYAEEVKRNLEVQMQQTQKLESLGVMAGGIAHDFNNILYAILGNVDLAVRAMSPEAAGREHLREIQTAARRASELTDQMLSYSGKATLAIEKIDLSGVVQEMAHLLGVSHSKKAIVKYHFGKNLPAIEADPSQLRQVVMNLITNASEAVGDESGFITVTTGVNDSTPAYLAATYVHDALPGGRYAYLEVTDTGCGMDEETQKRMFEPFFTTKFTGRGLGMAAVLGIVRAHHGAIDIDSEPGRGTTMRVLFPALDKHAQPPADETPQEEDWVGGGTILVVDDERQVRLLQQLVLEGKGFTVLTAENGREAVNLFRGKPNEIACVLLDLTMPHMGGEDTFAELRQIRDEVPVVLVSGYSEKQLSERVKELGFARFLKKPVQRKDLLDAVREALRNEKRV
jgi:two-component system, cell cycle sensor histidine kinase and response regulator CckA